MGSLALITWNYLLVGALSIAHLTTTALESMSLVAQQGASSTKTGFAWAILLLCIFLGLIVTLRPPRRAVEVKRPKED